MLDKAKEFRRTQKTQIGFLGLLSNLRHFGCLPSKLENMRKDFRRCGNRSDRCFVAGRSLRINHAWVFPTFVIYTDHLHARG